MDAESSESLDLIESHVFESKWWTPQLAGPVIAAAVVRLGLLAVLLVRFGIGVLFQSDTASYLEPGRNLLLHGRFIADGVPDLVRTPGYPLFLALTSLAGFPAAAVANVLLSVFSVILVWRLGWVVFREERIALIAAWFFAFEPLTLIFSSVLLSEMLFLTLFLLCMERLAEFLRGRRLRVLAAAGLWLAAATLVRPITYYLPVALAMGVFVALVRVPGLRWKAPVVLLISAMPWLAAWQMRNWVETGYGGMSSVSEINLYFDVAADVTARLQQRPFLDVRSELGYSDFDNYSGQVYFTRQYLARNPEQAGWTQGERLAFMHSAALRVIRAHYGVFLRSCADSLVKTIIEGGYFHSLTIPETSKHIAAIRGEGLHGGIIAIARANPWITAGKVILYLAMFGIYLFAAWGIFRRGIRNEYRWLLLGTLLYLVIISVVGTGGSPVARLRLPIMPLVCILAAAGLPLPKARAKSESTGAIAEAAAQRVDA
jgi:hypothetical protein